MLSVWREGMGGRGSVEFVEGGEYVDGGRGSVECVEGGRGSVECVLRGSEGVLSVCGGGQEQKHKVKAGD